jgi:hypothetical protein
MEIAEIKNAINSVRTQIKEIDQEIIELENRCAEIVELPLPYLDFRDWALSQYGDIGEKFHDEFRRTIIAPSNSTMTNVYMAPREGHTTLADLKPYLVASATRDLSVWRLPPQGVACTESFFHLLFADQIKAKLEEVFDAQLKSIWPVNVGLPRAQRIAELTLLEDRIAELTETRNRIATALSGTVQ